MNTSSKGWRCHPCEHLWDDLLNQYGWRGWGGLSGGACACNFQCFSFLTIWPQNRTQMSTLSQKFKCHLEDIRKIIDIGRGGGLLSGNMLGWRLSDVRRVEASMPVCCLPSVYDFQDKSGEGPPSCKCVSVTWGKIGNRGGNIVPKPLSLQTGLLVLMELPRVGKCDDEWLGCNSKERVRTTIA